MSLARTLASIHALHDLPRLLGELGHEPLWQELPPLHGASRAAAVGRHGDFTWLAVEAETSAPVLAGRIARRMAEEGRVTGVLAFYPAGREMGIGIAFGGCGVLRLDLDAPSPVGLASLARLRGGAERSATAYAARAEAAVTGRGVGREFFRQFRDTLHSLETAIIGGPRRQSDRRSLALLQLTRVLFLYFVQSKGWLDGRPDFLPRAVDACLANGRGLHRHLLQPLFFGTLNRPRAERSAAVHAFGRIPFLNGGLFEPHALERRHRFGIPDPAWRDAFDRLFERFHFTAAEAGGEGPSIGPDVLGWTFEGVMDPVERKASGTFYTPARLVHEVVAAGITAYTSGRLGGGDADAAAALERRDPGAIALLGGIAVLDPACGSGAFLLGALEQLAQYRAGPEGTAAARREVLRRNLFGVDLDAMAVRLAELRLWLAVVADDPADDPGAVRPLPNLDCLVRQGDSLFDPEGLAPGADPALARRSGALRARLVVATGAAKRAIAAELRAVELAGAREGCDAAERQLEREAEALLEAARAPTLFGGRVRPHPSLRGRLRDIRSALSRTRAARRRLLREHAVPWFHYPSHFADVMARGGFDLVIGNPPWVRAEELAPELRERLAARYRWWHGKRTGGYVHRPDLSIAFLERGHELARPGGAVAMLVPAKLAAAGYATAAREALAARTTIHAIADLTGDAHASFDATVYPLALVTTRRLPPPAHPVRPVLAVGVQGDGHGTGIPQCKLSGAAWTMGDGIAPVIERLRREHPSLGERYRCRLGVKTGADEVFLDPPEVEPEVLRWAVRGRDVRPFAVEPKRRILWTHDGTGAPLASLPQLAASHIDASTARLQRRADYSGGPVWTLFRTDAALARHRVVWRDLSQVVAAAALTGAGASALVPLNTCYCIGTRSAAEAHGLAAWLNATWIRGIARATAAPAAGGYSRYAAATIAALPIPAAAEDPELCELAREAASAASAPSSARRESSADADGLARCQQRIDERVAAMLSLTRDDRDVLAAAARRSAHRR